MSAASPEAPPRLPANRSGAILLSMKTRFLNPTSRRWSGLAVVLGALTLALPSVWSESAVRDKTVPVTGCTVAGCCAESAGCCKAKPARKAKTAKSSRTKPGKTAVTGSHLPQRRVVARFPETTSPVEVWDREVIRRSGEATLSGFLSRQSIFR